MHTLLKTDLEQKRHKDVGRQMNKLEHEMRELKFQFEEQKRSSVRMQDLIDKLQSKIKMHKKQIEEAVFKFSYFYNFLTSQ